MTGIAKAKGRGARFAPEPTRAVTDSETIREKRPEEKLIKELAEEYRVSKATVYLVLANY